MLAQVDELLDETLTEIGQVEGDTRRLDSYEYAAQLDKKMKERDQMAMANFRNGSNSGSANEINFN